MSKLDNTVFKGYDFSTPVVILKNEEDSHVGLGIIRSLGRLGVPVYSMISDSRASASFSRYSDTFYFPKLSPAIPQEELIDYLFQVARRLGRRSILIPTFDFYARFIARHSATLNVWFIFPDCKSSLVESLCSKQGLHELAVRHGVPTARSAFPKSRPELDEFIQHAVFPVIFKPLDWTQLDSMSAKKAIIFHSLKELIKAINSGDGFNLTNSILQECIQGDKTQDWMFNGYFDSQSNCLVSFTGKKLRQAPVYTGYTSLGECVSNEIVNETSITFLKKLGYRGIVDIDYRYDPADGLYKILDVNPRVGSTFRLFVGRNGLDVIRAMYLDVTGQRIPHDIQVEGRKWIVEDRDLHSAYLYCRNGDITLRDYLKSLKGIREGAWFALDDPRPFLMRIRDHIASRLWPFNR